VIGRTLYDVSQLLESADRADERMRRVLELLYQLVPYQQCAMLEARLGYDAHVVLVPEPSSEERIVLTRMLVDIFGQLVDRGAYMPMIPGRSDEARLAVPLVGLDEVIGILLVRSSVTQYDEEHLRALSVIAAKLAAYITIRGASVDLAELGRERDEARRIFEAARYVKDERVELVSAELRTPFRSGGVRAPNELENEIASQAQRLEDLLCQARLASAELRLMLREVASALGAIPSIPGSIRKTS
jgi:hypothetical protein